MLFLALLIFPSIMSAFPIPADEELYHDIDKLRSSGKHQEPFMWSKPYEADSVDVFVSRVADSGLTHYEHDLLLKISERIKPYLSKMTPDRQKLVLSSRIDVSYSGFKDADTMFARGTLGAAYSYGRFRLVNRVSGDIGNENDRYDHVERKYKGRTAADMPEAYFAYTGDHFGVLAGRNRYDFGVGRSGSLLLGNHGPSVNGVLTTASIGFLRGDALSAKLDPLNGVHRWFSAMKIGLNITSNFSIAFSQSVVYAGVNRNFEPGYVIPAFLYYFTQFRALEANEKDNLFLGAMAEYRFRGGRIYGELLADDFQVDRDSVSSSTQNALAFLVGASIVETAKRPRLCLEYVRLNSYVYKHMGGLSTHYLLNMHGGTLGHPLGPDADGLYVYLDKSFGAGVNFGAELTFLRLGSLNDPAGEWDAYGKADQSVPSGTVEKRYQLILKADKLFGKRYHVEGGVGLLLNDNNTAETNVTPVFKLRYVMELFRSFEFEKRAVLIK